MDGGTAGLLGLALAGIVALAGGFAWLISRIDAASLAQNVARDGMKTELMSELRAVESRLAHQIATHRPAYRAADREN